MSKRSSFAKFERGRKRSFLLTSSHFLLWPATNKPMHDEDEEEEKEEEETSRIVVAIRWEDGGYCLVLFGYDGVKGVLFAIVSRSMSEPSHRSYTINVVSHISHFIIPYSRHTTILQATLLHETKTTSTVVPSIDGRVTTSSICWEKWIVIIFYLTNSNTYRESMTLQHVTTGRSSSYKRRAYAGFRKSVAWGIGWYHPEWYEYRVICAW